MQTLAPWQGLTESAHHDQSRLQSTQKKSVVPLRAHRWSDAAQLGLGMERLHHHGRHGRPIRFKTATQSRQNEQTGKLSQHPTEPFIARAQRQPVADEIIAVQPRPGR